MDTVCGALPLPTPCHRNSLSPCSFWVNFTDWFECSNLLSLH
jgi:hypothetical protein